VSKTASYRPTGRR